MTTKMVLLISERHATHDPSCKWVAGTNGLAYRLVDVRDVRADQPRCSWCGGGR